MNARFILIEGLENRQFLTAAIGDVFAPPLQQASAGAITVQDVDVSQKLTGSWIGEIVGKEGLIATVQLNIKAVEPDGQVVGSLTLTQYPKDEAMTFLLSGQFNADKNMLVLEWNADKTYFGTLIATFDPDKGQLETQLNYNMAGEEHVYPVMLEQKPVWENLAKPGPCEFPLEVQSVVGNWMGTIYGKEGVVALIELNIKSILPTGEFEGTLWYQRVKEPPILVPVTGEYSLEKNFISLTWNQDKTFYGSMTATLNESRTMDADLDYFEGLTRCNYSVTLEKVQAQVDPNPGLPF